MQTSSDKQKSIEEVKPRARLGCAFLAALDEHNFVFANQVSVLVIDSVLLLLLLSLYGDIRCGRILNDPDEDLVQSSSCCLSDLLINPCLTGIRFLCNLHAISIQLLHNP